VKTSAYFIEIRGERPALIFILALPVSFAEGEKKL
jgi:hypothetical protein